MKKLIVFLFSSLLLVGSTFSVAQALTAPAPGSSGTDYSELLRQLGVLQQQLYDLQWRQNIGGSQTGDRTDFNATIPLIYTSIVPNDQDTNFISPPKSSTSSIPRSTSTIWSSTSTVSRSTSTRWVATTTTSTIFQAPVKQTSFSNVNFSTAVDENYAFEWRSGTDVLGASDVSKTGMKLEWSPLLEFSLTSPAIPYTLYRGNTVVYSGSSTSFTDSNLKCGTEYVYKVLARGANNTTKIYGPLTVKTSACAADPVPSVLSTPTPTLTVLSKNQIKISWNAVTGANKYKVTQYLYNGQPVYENSATSFTDDELDCNRTYKYTIQALGANGASSPVSSQYSATTLSCTSQDPVQKTITVTVPDDNQEYKQGGSMTIRWTSSGFTSGEKTIAIYKGTESVKTIANNISLTTNSYSWTIDPDFSIGNYRVVVQDNNTNVASGLNQGLFRVTTKSTNTTPKITILSPNGQAWQSGTNQEIQWDDSMYTGDTEYTIYVTQKDGESYGIIAHRVRGKSFTYNVGTINGGRLAPLASGETSYYIQVVRQGSPVAHSSNSPFSITPSSPTTPTSINVSSPKGGEEYKIGDVVPVKWKTENLPVIAKNKVFLSIVKYQNGVAVETSGGSSSVSNTGLYNWTIKSDTKPGLYKLRITPNCPEDSVISGCKVYGESTNTFEITANTYTGKPVSVSSPEGGERWNIGTKHDIKWNGGSFKDGADVQIRLVNMRTSVEVVIADTKNNKGKKYTWVIPSVLDTMDLTETSDPIYKISVRIGNNEVSDTAKSAKEFSIIDPRAKNVKMFLSNTPKSRNIKLGEQNAEFLRFNVENNGKEDVIITGVKLNGSLHSDDLSIIRVYEFGDLANTIAKGTPDTNISGLQLNVDFSPIQEIAAGELKTFSVKADVTTNSGSVKQKINIGIEKLYFKIGEKKFEVASNVQGKKMTIVSDGGTSPYMKVLFPKGGEIWKKGENNIIKWDTKSLPQYGYIMIALNHNNGSTAGGINEFRFSPQQQLTENEYIWDTKSLKTVHWDTNGAPTTPEDIQTGLYKIGFGIIDETKNPAVVVASGNTNSFTITSSAGGGTSSLPAPTAPSNIVVTQISPTSVKVSWTDNATTETEYYVAKGGNYLGSPYPANTTSATFSSGVTCGTSYVYNVFASNSAGASSHASTNFATTGCNTLSTGDVNGDSVVDCTDSTMILQSTVGNIILTADQKKRADVDSSGIVDPLDASILMRNNNLSCVTSEIPKYNATFLDAVRNQLEQLKQTLLNLR